MFKNLEIKNQICVASGLQGKDLEALKARLDKLSEAELQAELTRLISGSQIQDDMGLRVEKTQTRPVQAQNVQATQSTKTELTEEQAQDLSIEYLSENLTQAIDIYRNLDLGLVASGYDSVKSFFETELSSKNVGLVIDKEMDCMTYLTEARDGKLTRKEYYEKNKERLKDIIMVMMKRENEDGVSAFAKFKGNFSAEEFEKVLEKYISYTVDTISTMEGIKDLQHELLTANEQKINEFLKQVAEQAKVAKTENKNIPSDMNGFVKLDFNPSVLHPYNTEDLMTFEEVYELERGVEFSPEAVASLAQSKGEMNVALSAYNKYQNLKTVSDDFLKKYYSDAELKLDQYGVPIPGSSIEPKAEPRREITLAMISDYYALAPQNAVRDLSEVIKKQQLNLDLKLDENGQLQLDFGDALQTDVAKNKSLNLLLKAMGQIQEDRCNSILRGKSVDSYVSEYKSDYVSALGERNAEELSKLMEADNVNFVDTATGIAGMAGMAILAVGGGIVAAPIVCSAAGIAAPAFLTSSVVATAAGGATAIGGKVAIGSMVARNIAGFADSYKLESGFSNEDLKRRSKDLAMDLAGFIIGAGAGRTGLQYATKVARNGGSQAMAMLAEHGTDFTLSVAGDLAMIGLIGYDQGLEQTLKGNGIGILVSTLTGIKTSKMMFDANTTMPKTQLAGIVADDAVPIRADISTRLDDATSREEFVAIRDEIKAMPNGAEKTALQQEYMQKYGEFSRAQSQKFDIRMEYKPQTVIDITKLKIEDASIEDLKAIHKIDIEAFKDSYLIDSNFDDYKIDLEEQGISTYAIKADNGDVIGYYQLEPVENGELYIYSIGVSSDLRNTKASYAAIKQMQESITKFAQENNIEKVVLDVDASKPELVKLYKKFGFKITAEDKGVEAGHEYHDYRMEIDVKSAIKNPNGLDLPVIDGLKPRVPADSEVDEILLQKGFTDDDIAKLKDLLGQDYSSVLSAYNLLWGELGGVETPFRDIVMNELFDPEFNIDKRVFAYITEENLKFVKENFDVKPDRVPDKIVEEVSEYYLQKDAPEFSAKLKGLTQLNNDGVAEPRYNASEYEYLMDARKVEPKLVDRLVEMTTVAYDNRVQRRFSGKEIKKIAEKYKEMPDVIENVLKMTKYDENGVEKIYRFDDYHFHAVLDAYSKNPSLTEELIAQCHIKDGKEIYRFSGHEIKNIVLSLESDTDLDFVSKLLNRKSLDDVNKQSNFGGADIKDIIEAHKLNPRLTERLLGETRLNYSGEMELRFTNGHSLLETVKAYSKYPSMVDEALKMETINYSGKTQSRFQNFEIKTLVEAYDINPNFAEQLLYAKASPKMVNEPQYRYGANEIKMLTELSIEHLDLVEKFSAMTNRHWDGTIIYRFSAGEIKDLIKTYKKNADLVDRLLEVTKKDSRGIVVSVYTVKDIQMIVDAHSKNPKYVEQILGDKKPDGSNRFDGQDVKALIEAEAENPKFVAQLVECRDHVDGSGDYRFNGKEIKELVDASKDNPDLLQKILNETDEMTVLDGSKTKIYRFDNADDIVKLHDKFKAHPEEYDRARNWIVKNNGLSTDEILMLYPTQQKFYQQTDRAEAARVADEAKQAAVVNRPKNPALDVIKSDEMIAVENRLTGIGLHPKMAENYVKLIHENGIVDATKSNSLYELVNAFTYRNEKGKLVVGVSPKDVEMIFDTALGHQLSSQNGEFRPKLVSDLVQLKNCGVDDVKLATNISAIINMDDVELHARMNTKIREDVVNRVKALPQDVQARLQAAGLDIEALEAKALKPPKGGKVNRDNKPVTATVRTLDSIVGVEKVVLNKFKSEVPQEVWQDPARFKAWAEEKLAKVLDFEQNPDYIATGQYAQINQARKDGVESWYKFLKEESNYKDDVFVHLLVMDGITREMKPNNAATPPAVSHESFEATYNALLAADTKVSFSKVYAQQTREKAMRIYTREKVSLNGVEGQWVTIPRSKKGEPNYDEHIAMVQALSEGSSWCLRFENAHNYLQGGNLHFFVDKNGLSQVAINETDGKITQIQKRYDQDSTVPVAYSEVVAKLAKDNSFTGHEHEIRTALEAKPKFDELRLRLAKLMREENYMEVFKVLGFRYEYNEHGQIILTDYRPKISSKYTLHDLGIDENKLMQNVIELGNGYSTIVLDGSTLTTLPNLRKVNGPISMGDCRISDFSSLEEYNGHKIYWEKP